MPGDNDRALRPQREHGRLQTMPLPDSLQGAEQRSAFLTARGGNDWQFFGIELEHAGQRQRFADRLRIKKLLAQIHIEHAQRRGGGSRNEAADGLPRFSRPLRESAETDRRARAGKILERRFPSEMIPGCIGRKQIRWCVPESSALLTGTAFDGNTFSANTNALLFQDAKSLAFGTATGNQVLSSSGCGLYALGDNSGTIVKANTFQSNAYGIVLYGAKNITINGVNKIISNTAFGLYAAGDSLGTVVEGNQISGNGTNISTSSATGGSFQAS